MRYKVISKEEAIKLGVMVEYARQEKFGWCVLDTETNTVIGEDGGEPEDQLLVRDWDWVVHALNAAEKSGMDKILKIVDDAIEANEFTADKGDPLSKFYVQALKGVRMFIEGEIKRG